MHHELRCPPRNRWYRLASEDGWSLLHQRASMQRDTSRRHVVAPAAKKPKVFWHHFVAGNVGGTVGMSVCFPLDTGVCLRPSSVRRLRVTCGVCSESAVAGQPWAVQGDAGLFQDHGQAGGGVVIVSRIDSPHRWVCADQCHGVWHVWNYERRPPQGPQHAHPAVEDHHGRRCGWHRAELRAFSHRTVSMAARSIVVARVYDCVVTLWVVGTLGAAASRR